jgi:CheY-like chemotaxis protein
MNILYAEDSHDIAELIMAVLRNKFPSLHLTWVVDGELALEAFRYGKKEYHGIITDNNMDLMDGTELAEILRNSDKTEIPILMHTAKSEGVDPCKLRYLDAVIDKHDMESLFTAIKTHFKV